jgi:hypothetical protein
MYDRLGQKEDSASICLHGERIPHDYRSETTDELIANHYRVFHSEDSDTTDEEELDVKILDYVT